MTTLIDKTPQSTNGTSQTHRKKTSNNSLGGFKGLSKGSNKPKHKITFIDEDSDETESKHSYNETSAIYQIHKILSSD